jgi:nitrile hydratase
MDGAHDMGGVEGFGPVVPEPNEPAFHSDWERRAFAITLAMAKPGGWNLDMSRFARENRSPQDYLSRRYYDLWAAGLEQLLRERDLVTPDELAAGKPLHPPKPVPILRADDVSAMLLRGGPTERTPPRPARFALGDRVRLSTRTPPTHTRLPHYVRGQVGVIDLIHGCHVFPDSHAIGAGEDPQWLYTVAFDSRTLWGDDAEAGVTSTVDAWDPYLEPA